MLNDVSRSALDSELRTPLASCNHCTLRQSVVSFSVCLVQSSYAATSQLEIQLFYFYAWFDSFTTIPRNLGVNPHLLPQRIRFCTLFKSIALVLQVLL
jgi:hypothetical protein